MQKSPAVVIAILLSFNISNSSADECDDVFKQGRSLKAQIEEFQREDKDLVDELNSLNSRDKSLKKWYMRLNSESSNLHERARIKGANSDFVLLNDIQRHNSEYRDFQASYRELQQDQANHNEASKNHQRRNFELNAEIDANNQRIRDCKAKVEN